MTEKMKETISQQEALDQLNYAIRLCISTGLKLTIERMFNHPAGWAVMLDEEQIAYRLIGRKFVVVSDD